MRFADIARQRLIPPGSRDPRITPIGVIWHVADAETPSLYDYFKHRSGGVESHFYITYSGVIEQYRDTTWEADANYRGNSFIQSGRRVGYISVETEGLEYGTWTDAQLHAMTKLQVRICKAHNIPPHVTTSTRNPGIGYHTLFGAPSDWTPVAKSCPGPNRKKQFRPFLATVKNVLDGDDFDMDKDQFQQWVANGLLQGLRDSPYVRAELKNILLAAPFREYVDENGNNQFDTRTVSDILYSIHGITHRLAELDAVMPRRVWSYENENWDARDVYALLREAAADLAVIKKALTDVEGGLSRDKT